MMQSPAEHWNRIRWTAGGAIVESLFLKMHLPGHRAFWARYTLRRPGEATGGEAAGCLWAALSGPEGIRAGCDVHPAGAVDVAKSRFWLRVGPGELSLGRATGRVGTLVAADGTAVPGDLSWDLAFEAGPTLVHLPHASLYDAPLPRNKVVSPLVRTRFRGVIRTGGREIEVDGAPGMQGHNWGAAVAPAWAWCHVAGFEGEPDATLEAVTGRVPLGPVALPVTVVYLRWRGREWRLNGPVALLRARSRVDGLAWRFQGSGDGVHLEAEITADRASVLGLDYVSSDGGTVRCVNSNLAAARVVLRGLPGGPRTLAADGTATLELGGTMAPRDVPAVVRG